MTTRIVVELAVALADPHGWDYGLWDTDGWQAAQVWADVSCDFQGVTLTDGRSSPLDRYRPATGKLRLDNRTGKFDAWSELTPWAPPGVRHLGAGTRVRFGLEVGAAPVRWLFTGKADTWHHRYGGDDYVDVDVVDDTADLSLANLPEQTAQGDGEHAGARIARILAAHFYDGPTALDPGVPPLQPTTLADDALTLLYLTVDSDGGWLFCDGDGVLCFLDANRDSDTRPPAWSTPQLVIADDDSGDVCAASVELDDDREAVRNQVDIARAGGTARIARDDVSARRYGIRTMQRHDLIHTDDTWSQTLADRVVARAASGGTRVSAVEVWPTADAAAAKVAALRLHDQVRVVEHGRGDTFAADSYLDARTYDITPLGDDREVLWRATLNLSPLVAFAPAGRWDGMNWDAADAVWGY